jgi:hypothetical protein
MTPHEWAQLIVELIKAIAWPLAVGVIAWRTAPAFFAMLGGRSVDLQGFGIRATIRAIEQQASSSGESPVQRSALEPVTSRPSRPALQLIEQQIRTDLVQYPNREGALISALAAVRLQGQHEFTYNRIFGSQIAGLKRLDEIGSATVDEARAFFEPWAKMFPDIYRNWRADGTLFCVTGTPVKR